MSAVRRWARQFQSGDNDGSKKYALFAQGQPPITKMKRTLPNLFKAIGGITVNAMCVEFSISVSNVKKLTSSLKNSKTGATDAHPEKRTFVPVS